MLQFLARKSAVYIIQERVIMPGACTVHIISLLETSQSVVIDIRAVYAHFLTLRVEITRVCFSLSNGSIYANFWPFFICPVCCFTTFSLAAHNEPAE